MNINNTQLLWQLNFEGAWPTAVAFLGSGRKLAAANEAGQIYVWDLPETPPAFEAEKNSERKAPDHPPVRRLEGHTNGVSRLVGMCACSGNQIDSKPRSSAARASSAGFMASSVAKMNTPNFIGPSLQCRV